MALLTWLRRDILHEGEVEETGPRCVPGEGGGVGFDERIGLSEVAKVEGLSGPENVELVGILVGKNDGVSHMGIGHFLP